MDFEVSEVHVNTSNLEKYHATEIHLGELLTTRERATRENSIFTILPESNMGFLGY